LVKLHRFGEFSLAFGSYPGFTPRPERRTRKFFGMIGRGDRI
jgi:hypothetical protein